MEGVDLQALFQGLRARQTPSDCPTRSYECPACRDTGWIEAGERTVAPCPCQAVKRERRRLQESGLARQVQTMTFDRYRAAEPWQQRALDTVLKWLDAVAPAKAGGRCQALVGAGDRYPVETSTHSPAPAGDPTSAGTSAGSAARYPAPAPTYSPTPAGSATHSPIPAEALTHSLALAEDATRSPVPTQAPTHSPAPAGSASRFPAPAEAPTRSPSPDEASPHSPAPAGATASYPPRSQAVAPTRSPAPAEAATCSPAEAITTHSPAPAGTPTHSPAPAEAPTHSPTPAGAPAHSPALAENAAHSPARSMAPVRATASYQARSQAVAPTRSPAPAEDATNSPAPARAVAEDITHYPTAAPTRSPALVEDTARSLTPAEDAASYPARSQAVAPTRFPTPTPAPTHSPAPPQALAPPLPSVPAHSLPPARPWLFLGGAVGSGKTHLCTAACGELLRSGRAVRYMLWPEEARELKGCVNDAAAFGRLITPLERVDVLYIDDLFKVQRGLEGVAAVTPAEIRVAFELIDARYRMDRPTIISCEWFMDELLQMDEGVFSRVYERSRGHIAQIGREEGRNMRLKL